MSTTHIMSIKKEDKEIIIPTIPILTLIIGMVIGLCMGIFVQMKSNGFMMVALVATTSSFLSFFLQFTYQPGHIFGWWIRWIEKSWRDNPKNPLGFLANPLGLCAFCQNIWVTQASFLIAWWQFDLSLWWFIPCVVLSHMILTIISKLFWEE